MAGQIRIANVAWQGGMLFTGREGHGPALTIDADNEQAPGPIVTLLIAIAGCSGADIVGILEKMRVKLRHLHTEVRGERAESDPRRLVSLHLTFTLAGDGLDENKARRAIDLSVGKYCSVVQSLREDIPISYHLILEP